MKSAWLLLLALLAACAGSRPLPTPPFGLLWQPIDSLNNRLPNGIRAYAGHSNEPPIRAWYVEINEPDATITTRVVVSDDPVDRREATSSFARDLGACVAVNGGYFTMNKTPADHNGLLAIDGVVQWPPTTSQVRDSVRFETARAAIGFVGERVEIAWADVHDGALVRWKNPPPNRPAQPAPAQPSRDAHPWPMRDAIAAGPALIRNGETRVTAEEEVFFGTSIPNVHPRTAAGVTKDGRLVLMVVDGRQEVSQGVNLDELAALMRSVGAVDALNLDGGGSSTLVVDGVLLNRPTGGTFEREVMSALVTFCR